VWREGYGRVEENLDYLTDSYIRRKHWEWEQAGLATVGALGKALAGGGEGGGGKTTAGRGQKKQATLAQLSALGIGVGNGNAG